MKNVYFVRHGETELNKKRIHQHSDEPLNETGRKQAHEVALVLKEKNIEALLCSPFVRARQTAEIIGQELGLPLIFEDSVVEFHRPAPLYGTHHFSVALFWYAWLLYWHRSREDWDHYGAENMFAIRNRVLDVKKRISQIDAENIVVVSHAIFIDMFVQIACTDRSLTFKEFALGLLGAKKLPNTGIVTFGVDDNAPAETCNWWLKTEETNQQYLLLR